MKNTCKMPLSSCFPRCIVVFKSVNKIRNNFVTTQVKAEKIALSIDAICLLILNKMKFGSTLLNFILSAGGNFSPQE